jgi:hypothetical protein
MVDVEVGEDATALKPSVGSKRTCVGVRVSYGMRMFDCSNVSGWKDGRNGHTSSNADAVDDPTFFLCLSPEP